MNKTDKNQEGFALAAVLCIMFVIVVISASLLLATNMLVMNRNRARQNIQSRITTESLSDAMIEEIEGFRYNEEAEGPLETFLKEMDYSERLTMTLEDEILPGKTVVECYWSVEETFSTGLCLNVEVTNTLEQAKSTSVRRLMVAAESDESWEWKEESVELESE